MICAGIWDQCCPCWCGSIMAKLHLEEVGDVLGNSDMGALKHAIGCIGMFDGCSMSSDRVVCLCYLG
jgi:hypothetical protein